MAMVTAVILLKRDANKAVNVVPRFAPIMKAKHLFKDSFRLATKGTTNEVDTELD